MDHKMLELSEVEVQQIKEQNHRRIKRVVTVVAITLILLSIILVALSLSLGPTIDQLVSDSLDAKLSSKELFLGPKRNYSSRSSSDSNNFGSGSNNESIIHQQLLNAPEVESGWLRGKEFSKVLMNFFYRVRHKTFRTRSVSTLIELGTMESGHRISLKET